MNYREKIQTIRSDYIHGRISLDDAEKLVKPMIDEMNKIGQRIAKEHGKKFKKLTFCYIFR